MSPERHALMKWKGLSTCLIKILKRNWAKSPVSLLFFLWPDIFQVPRLDAVINLHRLLSAFKKHTGHQKVQVEGYENTITLHHHDCHACDMIPNFLLVSFATLDTTKGCRSVWTVFNGMCRYHALPSSDFPRACWASNVTCRHPGRRRLKRSRSNIMCMCNL